VESPAKVDRQLLRLRTRQGHAEAQGPAKSAFADPFATIHEFAMHEGDLRRWASEVYEPKHHPEPGCFSEGDMWFWRFQA
jgi:hypothetical protein